MVFTAAQTTLFWTDDDQMGCNDDARVWLQAEGLTNVQDLAEFDDDDWKNLVAKAGKTRWTANAAGVMTQGPPVTLSIKSIKRMKLASMAVKYHIICGRALTHTNMRFDPIIKEIAQAIEVMLDLKNQDVPEVPKITAKLPAIDWYPSFALHLEKIPGCQEIPAPLAYLIRDLAIPPAAPALLNGHAYSLAHGSVERELIERMPHNNAFYAADNKTLFQLTEEVTRNTSLTGTIEPFRRSFNGRGAVLAIVSQHAGQDKWQTRLDKAESIMNNRKFSGSSISYSLATHTNAHRLAFVSMQQCGNHVQFQLPSEHTRVNKFLSSITSKDQTLLSGLALVRTDTDGKLNDFEEAVSFLAPYCPIGSKAAPNKRSYANISSLENIDDGGEEPATKPGIGTTGVHFRYYDSTEYNDLTNEQKLELREWRESNNVVPPKKKGKREKKAPRTPEKSTDKIVAAAVAKALKSAKKKQSRQAKHLSLKEKAEAYNAIVSAAAAEESAAGAKGKPPAISVSALLQRVQKKTED